ncbi:hypothetical protein NOVOSPHI9U_350002 [Novosphingobium sp. 9U]|nr:hypothetical protein NOVOSPHI9U_350002 [Novosphingobium sp. 9U]
MSAAAAVKRSTGFQDGVLKSQVVEQPFDGGTLHISAACCDVPVAMGMRPHVTHDHLANRTLPCLRGAASLPDEASDEQVFRSAALIPLA